MLTKAQVVDALEKTTTLIQLGWIKSAWAKNAQGTNVDPWSEDATCFCIEGAIMGACHFAPNSDELQDACVAFVQAANKEFMTNPYTRQRILAKQGSGSKITNASCIPNINDAYSMTHKDVIRICMNAVKLAKAAIWS